MRRFKKAPSGLREFVAPEVPDHPFSIAADLIPIARRLGVKSVEVEEVYRGNRTKIVVPVDGRKSAQVNTQLE